MLSSQVRFEDVEVGQTFLYNGEKCVKQNDLGRFIGVCNAKDSQGNWCLFPMNMVVEVVEVKET